MVAKVCKSAIKQFEPYTVTFDITSREEAIALLCSMRQTLEEVESIIITEKFHTMLNVPNFSEWVDEIYEIQAGWLSSIEDKIKPTIK